MENAPQAPTGYRYSGRLFADLYGSQEWGLRIILLANLLALVPLLAGIVALWLPYQLYLAAGAPFAFPSALRLNPATSVALGLAVCLASMVLHEIIHAITLAILGYRPVLSLEQGYLAASVPQGDYLTRGSYLVMSLSPLCIMTLLGVPGLLVLPPAFGKLLLVALLLNCAASIGDLLVAQRVQRCHRQALFSDDGSIQVFEPLSQ